MRLDRFDWLNQIQEEAVDPSRSIVDPHHHLWDRGGSIYLAAQLQADTGATHHITHTVFVECFAEYRSRGPERLQPLGETEFVVAQAVEAQQLGGSIVAGIVAFADLSLGTAVEEILIEHERLGQGLFRGVRHGTAWDSSNEVPNAHSRPSESLLADPSFRAGLSRLAQMGYSFDAWLYHTQLHELVDVAHACPEATMIVNHLGGPLGIGPYAGRRHEIRPMWRSSLAELANCPNVVMKLGGVGLDSYFGMGWTDQAIPPTSDQVVDFWGSDVRWCIEEFGPDRCMFESNYPPDRQTCSYPVLWNSFQKIAVQYTESEQDALFSGTARRVYRLD